MSKGSRRVTIRVSEETIARVETQMVRYILSQHRGEDYGWTEFLREAIEEKLDKLERSKKASRKRRANRIVPLNVTGIDSPRNQEDCTNATTFG